MLCQVKEILDVYLEYILIILIINLIIPGSFYLESSNASILEPTFCFRYSTKASMLHFDAVCWIYIIVLRFYSLFNLSFYQFSIYLYIYRFVTFALHSCIWYLFGTPLCAPSCALASYISGRSMIFHKGLS